MDEAVVVGEKGGGGICRERLTLPWTIVNDRMFVPSVPCVNVHKMHTTILTCSYHHVL